MRRFRTGVSAGVLVLLLLPLLLMASTSQSSSAPESKFKVGDAAPDFTLKDQNGKDVSLHDFRGKKSVALAFFVFAFTGG